MKRVFPLIIVLITLSVVGILFMQVSWINNAVKTRREQYQMGLHNSNTKARDLIIAEFLRKANFGFIPDEYNKQHLLDLNFSITYFSESDIRKIIDTSLKAYNIKQPFEYGVTNIFDATIFASAGWKPTDTAAAKHIKLTSEDALNPQVLHILVQEPRNYIVGQMGWMIVASIILTIIVISAFALTVRTLVSQKKLNEIKSDFINNMTHELKTPLATISLATDSLLNAKVIERPDQIRFFGGMIKQENKRMNEQVETILQAARIERNEVQLNLIRMDAHEVIETAAEIAQLQVQEKGGTLTLNLKATKTGVMVDQVHFQNIIYNLLDNAMKYSDKPPVIDITTHSSNAKIFIKVKDQGIGMTRETMARVFEKFYRAHTGNVHNVKGFGLGLSYVKAMVEAMKGTVRVESAPGKGSAFTVVLPVSA